MGLRLLLTTDTVGGVWTFTRELAGALAERGVEVTLASLGGMPSPAQREEIGRLARVTLASHAGRLEWMADPWDEVDAAGEWLQALARQVGAEAVHLNQFAFGALPWEAPVTVTAHSCVTSWWEAVHREPAPAHWNEYRRRVRHGLLGADLVVAPTRAMLAALAACHGSPAHARVIPNGRAAHPAAVGPREPLVLSAGRLWDRAKNMAALDLAARGLPWPVYAAGETRHPDGTPVAFPGLRLLGPLPGAAMAEWLGRASIYAHPARYEPFGLAVLEAALAGSALVLGDIPSLREQWQDCAVFVPPDDADRLRSALRALIEDGPGRARLGLAARARAERRTPAAMAEAYLGAYAAARAARERRAGREGVACGS